MTNSFLLRWIVIFTLPFVAVEFCSGVKPGHGVVKGNVLLNGEPIRGVELWVVGAPFQQDNSWAVPIVTPTVVGVVGVDAAPSESKVYGKWTTDKHGHYELMLPPGRFLIYSTLPKKKDQLRVANIYKPIVVVEGHTIEANWDLSSKWSEAEKSKEEFYRSVIHIAAAAREEYPMRSILFLSRGDNSVWTPSVSLPGADKCSIMSLNSIGVSGQSVPLPVYDCIAQYVTPDAAKSGYELLVKLVTEATGWKAAPNPQGNDTIFSFEGLPRDDEVSVSLSEENRVGFSYTTFKRSSEYKRAVHPTDKPSKPDGGTPLTDTVSTRQKGGTALGSGSGPLIILLRKISAAAEERTPFASIRGQARQDRTSWATTVSLPDAESCTIAKIPPKGTVPSVDTYECEWKSSNDSQPEKLYDVILEAILRSGDWMRKPPAGSRTIKEAVFDASTGGRVRLTIGGSEIGVLRVAVASTNGHPEANRDTHDEHAVRAQTQTAPQGTDFDQYFTHVFGPQGSTAKQGNSSPQTMGTGILAVAADVSGTLFVDGLREASVIADTVVTLKLTAGQHFVDLRNNKGAKLWAKVVTVPAGAQIAERIGSSESPKAPPAPNAPISVVTQPRRLSFPDFAHNHDLLCVLERYKEAFDLDVVNPAPCPFGVYPSQVSALAKELENSKSKYCDFRRESEVSNQPPRDWKDCVPPSKLAHDLYVLGRHEEALQYSNEAVGFAQSGDKVVDQIIEKSSTYNEGASPLSVFEASNYWLSSSIYTQRARIKFALMDDSGALKDLEAAAIVLKKYRDAPIAKENYETQRQSRTVIFEPEWSLMHINRAIVLAHMLRFSDAMSEINEPTTGLTFANANVVRKAIQSEIGSSPSSIPNADATKGRARSPVDGLAISDDEVNSLAKDWFCEGGKGCEVATVSLSGGVFSARLEGNVRLRGQSCDAVKFPPGKADDGCNIILEFTGTVNGTDIEGVMDGTAPPPDSLGCGFPSEHHGFKGAIKDNGKVIVITSETNKTTYHWHNSNTYVWQKQHLVCDPATVDGTSPVMIVLRPKA